MSAHQNWLEEPYQRRENEAAAWESYCDAHEDDVRAELSANPDDIMREEVSEYVAQNLQLCNDNKLMLFRGMRKTFETSLEAAVKRTLAERYGGRS